MSCKLARRCGGTICLRSTQNNGCEDLGQDTCLGCGVGRFMSSEPFTGDSFTEMMRAGDVYGHFLPEGFTVMLSYHPEIRKGAVISTVDGMPLNPAWLALNHFEQQLPADEQPKKYELVIDGQSVTLTRP